ncbi:MAG: esterase/lipase family protein [bacterium]
MEPEGVPYRSDRATSWASFQVPLAGPSSAAFRQAHVVVEPSTDPLPPPPLLAAHPEWFRPIGVAAGTRSNAADAFRLPAELHHAVSPQAPLRVEVTADPVAIQDAFAIVPVASDGTYTYFVGSPVRLDARGDARRTRAPVMVDVTRLPDLGNEPSGSPEATTMRIGVWRAIKLGFFKIVGIPSADVGLRIPSLDGDRVIYRPVRDGELAAGKVALLVHGFLSDTSWMVRALLPGLRGAAYDHVVTWDYETFTSPIRATMEDLAGQLGRAGVAAGIPRLDVIAHSMGTLISRSLIASDPPLGIMRRALLMGAPNAGTPIAEVGDRITELASALVNVSYGPISARTVIRFLWERIDDGMDDLQPDSPLVRWLGEHPDHQAVPLTLLAGSAAGDPLGTLFERVLHRGADLFYGGPNDLVVPVKSMKSVSTPPYPSVTPVDVQCNHFDYLRPDRPGRPRVDAWVADARI